MSTGVEDANQQTTKYTYSYPNGDPHSVFQSNPFTVETGWPDTTWIDPNNVTDYQGKQVYGTATFYDALGRPIAEQDPAFGSGQAPGNPCPPLVINKVEANASDCAIYKLDTVSQIQQDSSDGNTYAAAESIDPDNHVSENYADSLGNTRYVINYSGAFSGTLMPNEQVVSLYNALNEPVNVTTTDLSPLNNQTISSVTAAMQYDDLGRLTQEVDPDRGTHNYTYDADSQLLDDATGNRTIGYNYDLLGRVGCVQSGAVTSDADGSCTTPNNAIIQNTYDTTEIGTQGVNDFPIGRLTKTQATTTYPEGGSVQSTEKFQYDTRGRVTTEQLKFSLPSSWNVTNALPTDQMAFQYTDADQLSSSVSSTINGQGQSTPGYSTFQNYDQYTGVPIGLSTQTSSTPNLAALTYNTYGLVSNLAFQNGAGTEQAAEAFSYDGDLRPSEDTAVWESGSGQSGQFFDETRSFDQASNLVSQTTTLAAVSGLSSTAGSETNDYCYDEQNRLVWASNSQQPSPTGAESCGSATAGTTFSAGSYTNTFTYTHLGQLWHAPVNGTGGYQQYLYCNSAAPHQVTNIVPAGQGYSCTNLPNAQHMSYAAGYDNWGNVTSRTYNQQTATLSYNKLDEMVEWQIPSTNQAWYAYDSSGERTLQRTTIGTTTTMTVYAFGLEEYNYDGSGNLQNSTHYYTLGGRLLGELQQSGSTSTTNYFLTDNLGSVLAVFNSVSSSAALLSTQLYAPYGASRFSAGTPGTYTNKGYTGQYNDSVSGLDYYNARYYDPVSGVFLSADTMEGNDSGMNPYAYAGGNPATYSDPSGTMFNDEGEGGGGEIENGGTTAVASYSGESGWEGGDWGDWGDTSSGPVTEPLPAVNVTQGNVTYNFDQTDGELTTTTTNADGSTTTAGYLTTDAAYATQYSAFMGAVAANDIKPPAAVNSATLHHSTATPQTGSPVTGSSGNGYKPPSGGSSPAAGDPCSFTPNTPVATANGEQAIGKLHVGEKVWAYNPKTKKMELQPIEHVWIHQDSDLVDLTITYQKPELHGKADTKGQAATSEVVHTTSEHPFYTTERGFTPAGKLKAGMHILRADGSVGVVTQTRLVHRTKTMYNLEVAHDHTFVVGSGQWVVHNECDSGPLRRALGLPANSPSFSQQAQHLTPCQTSTTGSSPHPMVTLAEQNNAGFLNGAWNGMGLPDNWRDAADANLPRHVGRHSFYTGQVIQLLNIEWGRVLAATSGNPSVGDAQAGVQRVSNWARAKISAAGGGCTINQVDLGVGGY